MSAPLSLYQWRDEVLTRWPALPLAMLKCPAFLPAAWPPVTDLNSVGQALVLAMSYADKFNGKGAALDTRQALDACLVRLHALLVPYPSCEACHPCPK